MPNDRTQDALRAIEDAHPGWVCWEGVTGLLYARRLKSSPPAVYLADTPGELEARITGHERRRQ